LKAKTSLRTQPKTINNSPNYEPFTVRQGRVSLSMHKEKTTAFLFTQVNLLNVRRAYPKIELKNKVALQHGQPRSRQFPH